MNTQQRTLGQSDLLVPAIGVGTMSWGMKPAGYGKLYTREDLWQAYRACLDNGLNYFDTSEDYGDSERLLGEFQREDGRSITIGSKFNPSYLLQPSRRRSQPEALLASLDASLRRLGVKQVDLYQIHYPPPARRFDAFIDALAESVLSGKARAVGVSNFNAERMRRAAKRLARRGVPLASNQVGYNLLRRFPETSGLLDACHELNVALIAAVPLAEGVLAGKMRGQKVSMSPFHRMIFYASQLDLFNEFHDGESFLHRALKRPRLLQGAKLEPLFVAMDEAAKAHNKTLAQVALNWLITNDPLVIPIAGVKSIAQAQANAGAMGWQLTADERMHISDAEIATR